MARSELKILTTIPGVAGRFWGDHTTLASEHCVALMYRHPGMIARNVLGISVAIGMLARAHSYDAVVVESGSAGLWYTWLSAVLRQHVRPTVMIDCLWYRESSWIRRAVKRWLTRLSSQSVDIFIVWARHEVDDYSQEFKIARDKFVFLPFHATLDGYAFEIQDEGFVFAGGDWDRDYRTLIEAVRDTDIPVFIATRNRAAFGDLAIPENVTVSGISAEEFRQKLASCRMAVVPMAAGLLHSGGQQTFLNSMLMGKPTIVVGERAADGYVEDGVTGSVVGYGDVASLRREIMNLYGNTAERDRIGAAGRAFAATMTTDRFVHSIHSLVSALVKRRR